MPQTSQAQISQHLFILYNDVYMLSNFDSDADEFRFPIRSLLFSNKENNTLYEDGEPSHATITIEVHI